MIAIRSLKSPWLLIGPLSQISQFCAQALRSGGAICRQQRPAEDSERVLEATRRRMVVEGRLENRGENAYNARLDISYTPNLYFSSLIVKVRHREEDRSFAVIEQ